MHKDKSWALCRHSAFLGAPFSLHFNWISATSWMVLERWSVAYCGKKTERPAQMGSLYFPLPCHCYVIFPVQVISGSERHVPAPCTCELQRWPSLENITKTSLRSVLASARYCPTKLKSLKRPPEWLYFHVAIKARISHPFSIQKMWNRGLLSRCVHFNGPFICLV